MSIDSIFLEKFYCKEDILEQEAIDTFFAHYGVKGMKWGVRKRSPEKQEIRDASKNRRKLSDSDLDKYIARLEKEKKLKNLSEESTSQGKTFAKNVMTNAGQRALTTIATGAVLYATKVALTKEFNFKDAASYVTPRPKTK